MFLLFYLIINQSRKYKIARNKVQVTFSCFASLRQKMLLQWHLSFTWWREKSKGTISSQLKLHAINQTDKKINKKNKTKQNNAFFPFNKFSCYFFHDILLVPPKHYFIPQNEENVFSRPDSGEKTRDSHSIYRQQRPPFFSPLIRCFSNNSPIWRPTKFAGETTLVA